MSTLQRIALGTLVATLVLAGCATPGPSQPASSSDVARSVLGGFSIGGINVGAAASAATHAADAMRDIPQDEEIAMGRDIAAGLLGAAPLAKSSEQEIYVNNVGRWLALHSSRPDLPWHFGILDVDTVNAFATPGGNVFISRGLIARIHGESELAGILAHEISHVALKHHLADIQKNAQKNLALDLASVKSGGLAGEAARAVARVGLEGYVRGLSREDELAADRMGVVIAARAGYEPYGLVAVLQTLAAEPQSDAALGFFLKTHPAPNDRIAALEAEMPPSFEAYSAANPALARYAKVFPARR
ncbi:MAG TPA: M48 family metalloprotease [Casimicrobiaceae bacterium]|jgi:predicted Zn-dependent protease